MTRLILLMVILILFLIVIWVSPHLSCGNDWYDVYRPATLMLLNGQSPYLLNEETGRHVQQYFYNPPWTLIPFIPIALLPSEYGRTLQALMGIVAFGYTAYKKEASPIFMILLLSSPPVLLSLWLGNVEWLVLLGLVFQPEISLFFLLIKPQMTMGIIFFYLVEAFRRGKAREVIRVFLPVSVALTASFLLFGFWPVYWLTAPSGAGYTNSIPLFPYGLVPGVVMLFFAIKDRKEEVSIAASPFFSPYIAFNSLSGIVFAAYKSKKIAFILVLSLWLLGLISMIS